VGATVHPVTGPAIEDGVVLVDGETIVAVGPRAEVEIPQDADVHDISGKHLTPGLIDLHSHIGGGRLHESLAPVQAGVSAVDAIDPSHASLERARAGGITTVHVMPGSGKLLGGQTALLHLRQGALVDELLLCRDPESARWAPAADLDAAHPDAPPARHALVCGGVKMANGTNPQGEGQDPRSRMGSAYLQRKALLQAKARAEQQDQARAWAEAGWWTRRRLPKVGPPAPDIAEDALVQVVRGERPVHFHSHRADDMVTALRLREEVGPALKLVLHHGSEGFKVGPELAQAGVPVAINVLDTPGGKEETLERTLSNPARVAAAGVTVALITDDPVQDSRLLLRSAGLAVRGGLAPELALRAVTRTPAELLGLADQTGALEPGLWADLVVLSGPPLSVWSHVEETWVAGERVFDRADPRQRRAAVGGDGGASAGAAP
jgi:imidazolonepropionase-like amidohydrolase